MLTKPIAKLISGADEVDKFLTGSEDLQSKHSLSSALRMFSGGTICGYANSTKDGANFKTFLCMPGEMA